MKEQLKEAEARATPPEPESAHEERVDAIKEEARLAWQNIDRLQLQIQYPHKATAFRSDPSMCWTFPSVRFEALEVRLLVCTLLFGLPSFLSFSYTSSSPLNCRFVFDGF